LNPSEVQVPEHWTRGQLLNVRPHSEEGYALTLIYDGEYDERKGNGIVLANLWECQAFVSWWYSRSSEPQPVVDEAVQVEPEAPRPKHPRRAH
jgi:hypothetical protein